MRCAPLARITDKKRIQYFGLRPQKVGKRLGLSQHRVHTRVLVNMTIDLPIS